MQRIIICGCGGHAKVVIDIVRTQGLFQVSGIVDPQRDVGESLLGIPVVGNDEEIPLLMDRLGVDGVLVAIGNNKRREEVVRRMQQKSPGVVFVNAIHPSTQVGWNVTMGTGNVVMPGCVINAATAIGNFCVLNTLSSIDHDCKLHDFVNLAPHACLAGNVELGRLTEIGMGSSVIQNVTIGANTIVGAGSTVLRDLPSDVVAYGSPARSIRERSAGD